MAQICREVQEWIEEEVEQPVEEWENQQQERCEEEDCNWWMLCLNKLVCWFVWVLVKVVRWVMVTVGKWVTRAICETVVFVLDVVAVVVNLVLSIPIIGGIIRTILNWVTEIIWRAVGFLDFVGSLLGIRPRKKMYVGIVIPLRDGAAITTEAAMMPQITRLTDLFDTLCNIEVIYTGACTAISEAPDDALTIGCDAGGFFSDWWIGGSYLEFTTSLCKFTEGFRRVIGHGGQIVVVPIRNVTPDSATSSTVGCSFASTHNYVLVEPGVNPAVTAHEVGHACWLTHSDDEPGNLMFPSTLSATPTLTDWQISVIRWSKHCVYL